VPIRRCLLVVALLLVTACSSGSDDSSSADGSSSTTVATTAPLGPPVAVEIEGPITGGDRDLMYNAMPEGFEETYGYTEDEWFVSGEATAYAPVGTLEVDGAWTVEPTTTAPYKTRIIVRHPIDPEDYNGITLVEWNNVSAGRDSDPDFGFLHPEIFSEGYAYVSVSAQRVGIEGGGALVAVPGVPAEALVALKEWDPERYAPLSHPGDEYSYDIYSQIGAIAEGRADANPLADFPPTAVIAIGESQSAFRLVSYVDAVQPLSDTFDGVLIHSRSGGAAPLGPDPAAAPPNGTLVRTDLDVPVLVFQTETDLGFLGFIPARQPNSDGVVTWEVAGTAHADQSSLDYGIASGSRWSDAGGGLDLTTLCGTANSGPQPEVVRAALEALRAWVVDETPPPTAPLLETTADGEIVRDADGNALGGVRTPAVDAPVSSLTGAGNPSSIFCSLFGQEHPLSPERLAQLYPTHADYVAAVTASADAALDAGFLLEADHAAIIDAAEQSDVGA
jgi:Alpha/beta hydrolase domain